MRGKIAAVALGLWALAASPVCAEVFSPEVHTLSNGLRVLIVPGGVSPAAAHMMWYKVGAVDESPGHSGLAHYLEHMMFRGTEKVGPGAYSAKIASLGGRENAFTTHDATAYHVVIAPEHLGLVMELEADRMQNLAFDPALAATELSVVQSERQQRTDNSPEGKFSEELRAALFGAHPYGRPVIGWPDELRSLDIPEAQKFYKTHYCPTNAILIVTGAVNPSETLRLAQEKYGAIPACRAPSSPPSLATWQAAATRIDMTDARVKQARFALLKIVDSARTGPARDAAAREVLAELLGGGEVGLLYRTLVRQQGVASATGADYDSVARGPSVFSFSLVPAPGTTPEKAENALRATLAAWDRSGFSSREIAKAKGRLVRAALFARDGLMTPAHVLGEVLATGGPLDEVEDWPARIAAVRAADVTRVFRALVAAPQETSGWLRPPVKEETP